MMDFTSPLSSAPRSASPTTCFPCTGPPARNWTPPSPWSVPLPFSFTRRPNSLVVGGRGRRRLAEQLDRVHGGGDRALGGGQIGVGGERLGRGRERGRQLGGVRPLGCLQAEGLRVEDDGGHRPLADERRRARAE